MYVLFHKKNDIKNKMPTNSYNWNLFTPSTLSKPHTIKWCSCS